MKYKLNGRGINHKQYKAEYKERYKNLVLKMSKARSYKSYYADRIEELIKEENAYCNFFGLKNGLSLPENWDNEVNVIKKQAKILEEKKRKANEKRYKELELQRIKEQKVRLENLEKWVQGEELSNLAYEPTRMRIKGGIIQTSHGAEFPLDHGIKAFTFLKQLKANGEAYQNNGHSIHLGHFIIDSVDSEGNVKAGCHYVEWQEIERIANLAGVN